MQRQQNDKSQDIDQRLAIGLGWFSIGLGVAEIVAPGGLARLIGLPDRSDTRNVLRTYGAREIAAGVGILSQPQAATWMWTRVAGDLLDLGTLAKADKTDSGRTAAATAAVLGVTALDIYCAQQLTRNSSETTPARRFASHAVSTVVINKSPEEIYSFWRNFENLPQFMTNLESVRNTEGGRSRWTARGPFGKSVEWEAEIVNDQPNSSISWRAVEGSDVDNAGSVHFERGPGGRGTIVRVEVDYTPPGGIAGAAVAKLLWSDPQQQMDTDLKVFKQIMETGEIVRSDASIHRKMHAAQPSAVIPADSPAMQPQQLSPVGV